MLELDLKALVSRLDEHCTQGLHNAAGLCMSRGHYEVSLEHHLLKLMEEPRSDIPLILDHFDIPLRSLQDALNKGLDQLRSGNPGKPVFSPLLTEWFQDAWLLGSVEYDLQEIRSGLLLMALILRGSRYATGVQAKALSAVRRDDLRRNFLDIVASSIETKAITSEDGSGQPGASEGGAVRAGSALARFTVNFTEQARQGLIDPVFGRDTEIRQMVDILARRRRNNPIVVGEPGVGKTAVVEGLALRIVQQDVPKVLQGVELLSLDLGLLQAGAGVRGEFENRLKSVIQEVKESPVPLVMFIDEAHTMIGAGGSQGGGDAANLLKPALARGELRTVAATTWKEYKRYFEKDAALSRRFELVKLDEPSEESAIVMLRGLAMMYEKTHGVHIRDDAVVAAVELSNRYISGRLLPDKAVGLLDTAAARVRIGQSTIPPRVEGVRRMIEQLLRELGANQRDVASGIPGVEDRSEELEACIEELRAQEGKLTERWEREQGLVERVLELRKALSGESDDAAGEDETAGGAAGEEGASTLLDAESVSLEIPRADEDEDEDSTSSGSEDSAEGTATVADGKPIVFDNEDKDDDDDPRQELSAVLSELHELQGEQPLIHPDVGPEVVAEIVSDWTGIPVGRMVKDEAEAILRFEDEMGTRIKGQDHALESLGERLRQAKAGLQDPTQPIGVFLLVGPSGVGKTETALGLADLLYGGERSLISINMSEFQEKHTVSRLIGSPPGYVGFGEGGILTEAVRQKPYSVVLLDECEKADPEVLNLFYQVFDKGTLSDGEGREIDFRNTVILLTSNLATKQITAVLETGRPDHHDELVQQIRPVLSRHFKPALLARMTVVPYYPLPPETLRAITELKLGKVGRRLQESHGVELSWSEAVADAIAARCTEVETGARNVDHIIRGTLLPELSKEILARIGDEGLPSQLHVTLDEAGRFTLGEKE